MPSKLYMAFQFLNFSLKVVKDNTFLIFSEIRFRICGPLYVIVSGSKLNSFFIVGMQVLEISEVVMSFFKREDKRSLLKRVSSIQIYIFLWRDVQDFVGVEFFFLTFLRYHRKKCCSYRVLIELLVCEYCVKVIIQGPWAEHSNHWAESLFLQVKTESLFFQVSSLQLY